MISFLLTFRRYLSRTVSKINCDSVENRKFPRVFNASTERFPLELGNTMLGLKKIRMMGLLGRKKFDDTFSRLDTTHEYDGWTDGHRPTASTALTHSVSR